MLLKTKGIVLGYIKYRETSIIVKIFTEEFGLQTYVQNGVRSPKAKTKMALFQPMTLLDMVVYHKTGQEINRISELKCEKPLMTLQSDFKKLAVGMFLVEVITKCLHQAEANKELFDFVHSSFLELDKENGSELNIFHIKFLFELSGFLGFHPDNYQEFQRQMLSYKASWLHVFNDDSFKFICVSFIEGIYSVDISPAVRSTFLDILCDFYHIHIENFGEMRSLKVLREL